MNTPAEIHAEVGLPIEVSLISRHEYRAYKETDIAKIIDEAKGESKPLVINQDLINKIIQTAKNSKHGLDDPDMQPDIEKWSSKDFDTLAHCLVSSWSAKYDLVSIFSAAMKAIHEAKAESKGVCEWQTNHHTYYATSCGRKYFTKQGEHCPGCGKEIKTV